MAQRKDAMVAMAGTMAQHRYYPHWSSDIAQRWRECPFDPEDADCQVAMSLVGRMQLVQNGAPDEAGPITVELTGEQAMAYA